MKTLTITLSLLVPAIAAADTPVGVEATAKAEPTNSINASPLGLVVGDYALTYEHLFGGSHGLIVEGIGSRSSDDTGSALQFGGGVGYRWHWRGRQNSGFLGVMAAQRFGAGSVTENGMQHDMTIRSTSLTANIGKRWAVTDAVNVTFRIGGGWGHYTATAKEDTMEAKQAEKLMNDILTFIPIAIDGELSVGYAF